MSHLLHGLGSLPEAAGGHEEGGPGHKTRRLQSERGQLVDSEARGRVGLHQHHALTPA